MRVVDCDWFVVGSGMSGLLCALRLAGKGRVLLATKAKLADANTNFALDIVKNLYFPSLYVSSTDMLSLSTYDSLISPSSIVIVPSYSETSSSPSALSQALTRLFSVMDVFVIFMLIRIA